VYVDDGIFFHREVVIDSKSKAISVKENAVTVHSARITDEAISELRTAVLESGLFEIQLEDRPVVADAPRTEFSIVCNGRELHLTFSDIRLSDVNRKERDVFNEVVGRISEFESRSREGSLSPR